MTNGEHSGRGRTLPIVATVMGSVLVLGTGLLITVTGSARGKAEQASKDVITHDGSAEAHPVLQERIDGNYEKIQIQQTAIKDDIADVDEKLDRVLEAVEK